MPPVIKKREKFLMYALIVSADISQFIIDCLVVEEGLNHGIDFAVGGFLFAYALKRKLLTAQKGLVLGATFAAEQIPFVNALPFWTFDLRNLYKNTQSEEPLPPVDPRNLALYEGGVRRPSNTPPPLNQGNTRPPRKNGV